MSDPPNASTPTFEVEWTGEIGGCAYVIARLLDPADFRVGPSSTLGEVRVEEWPDAPRALDADGAPRVDLYALRLRNAEDRARFVAGERVQLWG